MRPSEWIAFAYFATLTVAAWLRPLPIRRRVTVTLAGLAMSAFTLRMLRPLFVYLDYAAPVWILAGYYLSGLFFTQPSERFEAWLADWDRRLLGDPTTRFAGWPRLCLACLDIIYMGCFLLIVGGAAVLLMNGRDTGRYWTMVTAAELGAFLPLTIVQSRPPWAIERRPALRDKAVHRAALVYVREVTIGANTFPSGHASGSLAAALAVTDVLPVAGALLLALALAVCVSAVVGRYHYAMDVIAGIALALAIWIAV